MRRCGVKQFNLYERRGVQPLAQQRGKGGLAGERRAGDEDDDGQALAVELCDQAVARHELCAVAAAVHDREQRQEGTRCRSHGLQRRV